MKPLLTVIALCAIILSTGCKKYVEPDNALNGDTILYDKTPAQIISSIHGKWALNRTKGGLIANNEKIYTNLFWEFSADNRFKSTNNGVVEADVGIVWYRDRGAYLPVDSTYQMKAFYKDGTPFVYIFNRISKDTLRMNDYALDAVFYFLTRVK